MTSDLNAWHDLWVMSGGAAAALAGLIFVAVALNHESILSSAPLPALAARTVAVLIGLVILCGFLLTPGQSLQTLGIELTVLGATLSLLVIGTTVRWITQTPRASWRLSLVALAALSTTPGVVAGVLLTTGAEAGLYWALGEIIAAITVSTYNAWTLLIEIRR
jgi:modulator of FtsH protease